MTIKRAEAKWIVSKSGKHTCSGCGFVADDYSRVCPNCNADMGLTVKRKMKYRCECCHELFESFAYRYDYCDGEDASFCPLCGCKEPGVEEVWEDDD